MDQHGKYLWGRRAEWQRKPVSPSVALAEGEAIGRYPIVIADQADNPGGGAPSDSTEILNLFIERNYQDALLMYAYFALFLKIIICFASRPFFNCLARFASTSPEQTIKQACACFLFRISFRSFNVGVPPR
jgi:hypothetical protein